MSPAKYFRRKCCIVFLVFLALSSGSFGGENLTAVLSEYPEFSGFLRVLTSTGVTADLSRSSSLTVLAVPNRFLRVGNLAAGQLSDVVRYHVLLQYFDQSDIRRVPASGDLVTTLYQTTGRASDNLGALNLSRNPSSGTVSAHSTSSSGSSANFLGLVRSVPYSLSVFSVDALLLPSGLDISASEARPQAAVVNITRVLLEAKDFNVVGSMLVASGVMSELESDENGAGITCFLPTDEAFASIGAGKLQNLPADNKAVVLKYHVLHSYYPLGSLQSIVNPVQPTLATEEQGAGHFTLNITRANGSVAIDTGILTATITQTVFDQNPVAIFGISVVLLPKEIFGKGRSALDRVDAPPPLQDYATAVSPGLLAAEAPANDVSTPGRAVSAAGTDEDASDGGGGKGRGMAVVVMGILGVVGVFIGI